MEQIIKNYGGFLLDAMVLVVLMTLLFMQTTDAEGNRGILHIIGAGIETDGIDYAAYTDIDTYMTESSKPAPVISFDGNSIIHVGNINLADYIKAMDCTGAELQIRVLAVTDSTGAELPCSDTINFSRAGIYSVTVTAVDAWNKRTTSEIRIVVNA